MLKSKDIVRKKKEIHNLNYFIIVTLKHFLI